MSKKTQSLYLDEATHSDVSAYVMRSLDGRGSINEFLGFIEERTYEQFSRPSSPSTAEPAIEAFDAYLELPPGALVQPLDEYRQCWEALADRLPWHDENPVASHTLALFALTERPVAWAKDTDRRQARSDKSLTATLEEIRGSARRSPVWNGMPVWRRGRVDIIGTSTSAPVSFYLEPIPHQFFAGMFANRNLFAYIEEVLQTLYWDEDLWIDIVPELTLLELGPNRITSSTLSHALRKSAQEIADAYELVSRGAYPEELPEGVPRPSFEESFMHGMHALDQPRWQGAPLGDALQEAPEVQLLRLAKHLDVLDPQHLDELPQRMILAFLKRYRVATLTPNRAVVETILRTRAPSNAEAIAAPEFHILEMYRHYAATVLNTTLEAPETSLCALVTMGQPWVLRTKNILERFSTARVSVTPTGNYRLTKSRHKPLELDPDAAVTLAETLHELIAVDDTPFGGGFWLIGLLQRAWEGLPGDVSETVSIPIGIDLIERARAVLEANNWNAQRAAALLALELLDHAHQGGGAIAHQLESQDAFQCRLNGTPEEEQDALDRPTSSRAPSTEGGTT